MHNRRHLHKARDGTAVQRRQGRIADITFLGRQQKTAVSIEDFDAQGLGVGNAVNTSLKFTGGHCAALFAASEARNSLRKSSNKAASMRKKFPTAEATGRDVSP